MTMTEPVCDPATASIAAPPPSEPEATNVIELPTPVLTTPRSIAPSRWHRWQRARSAKKTAKEQQRLDARFGQVRLTAEQLSQRLFLKSSGIAAEIHSMALRQIQSEEQRESRLDGKAQGLLVTAGLSLTAASTFGGIYLHPEYMKLLGRLAPWAILAYGLALLCGVAASACAVHALFVRDEYQTVDEQVVLDETALKKADEGKDDIARAAYLRYITVHHWQIWQQHFGVHQEKASIIRRGQILLLAFLIMVMLVGFAVGYTALQELP